nr:hypothetical protein CFP56_02712 [Quercus suber]
MQHTPAICPSTKPQLHQPKVFCSIWLALLDELYGSGSPPAVFVDPLPDADQRSSFSYSRAAITLLTMRYNVRLSPCCSRSCNAAQRSRGRDPQGLLTRATLSCRCFSTNLRINECRKKKLRLHHTASCPSLFPEGMYCPFWVCEAKSSDRPIEEAERQKILAISVTYDSRTVKRFGNSAVLNGEINHIFRHPIYQAYLSAEDIWRIYKIVRGVCECFFPGHLEQTKKAIAHLHDQASEPISSQELIAYASFSRGDSTFKKPSLPAISIMQWQSDGLSVLVQQLRDQTEHQKEEIRQIKEEQKV